MSDPVLVEVTRGSLVESRHAAALVVCDADGGVVLQAGDIDRAVFPRSAVKALQALPLIETGAADRCGLEQREIALACASHSGFPLHAETAARMLAKAGRDATCLECGTHWPMDDRARIELAASGAQPSALHNNCSGKHAGFVCVAEAMNVDVKGYVRPGHPVMRGARAAIEAVTGARLDDATAGVDGCSIPTYAVPLRALAHGFARFGTGVGLSPGRARAAARIREAVSKYPEMVAGEGRFDTRAMALLGARAFVKTGAEGVYCAAFPEAGLGVAIKCDDGATRASVALMASMVRRFVPMSPTEEAQFAALADGRLVNWNGIEVGEVSVSGLP